MTILRWAILIDIVLIVIIFFSPINDPGNWALGLMLGFPIMTLIPLITIEIALTLLKAKMGKFTYVAISLISIPLSVVGTWKCAIWYSEIENILILPNNYDKDYLIVLYKAKTGARINPSIAYKRKRRLLFPHNGIFLTSTELTSSYNQINNPKIFKKNGEKVRGKFDDDRFRVSNGFDQGYKYSIIYLSDRIIYNRDSLFRVDNIDFLDLDKY